MTIVIDKRQIQHANRSQIEIAGILLNDLQRLNEPIELETVNF